MIRPTVEVSEGGRSRTPATVGLHARLLRGRKSGRSRHRERDKRPDQDLDSTHWSPSPPVRSRRPTRVRFINAQVGKTCSKKEKKITFQQDRAAGTEQRIRREHDGDRRPLDELLAPIGQAKNRVVELSLPAGSYLVNASTSAHRLGTSTTQITCSVRADQRHGNQCPCHHQRGPAVLRRAAGRHGLAVHQHRRDHRLSAVTRRTDHHR